MMASRCRLNRGGWGGVGQAVGDTGLCECETARVGVGGGAEPDSSSSTNEEVSSTVLGRPQKTPHRRQGHCHMESCLGQFRRVRFGAETLTLVIPRFEV